MKLYFYIAIGGFFGALSRFMCNRLISWDGTSFPVGTLSINLIGCFILGYLTYLPLFQKKCSIYVRTGITTGFIGSFTTFSTFSVESLQMLQQNQVIAMVSYILLSIAGGYLFIHFGYRLAFKQTKQGWEREKPS